MISALHIAGLGLAAGDIVTTAALAARLDFQASFHPPPEIPPEILRGADTLASIAIRALYQAAHPASAVGLQDSQFRIHNSERTALLLVSGWGTIESTAAYLESMIAEAGRFASPRHFTRSVHSSVASAAAIALNIHGPCETLAFDAHPVSSALDRAAMLLESGRCDAVMVCWADEKSDWTGTLARIAVEKLGRKEQSRYLAKSGEGGGGAIAVRIERQAPALAVLQLDAEPPQQEQGDAQQIHQQSISPAYPMDGSLALAATVLAVAAGQAPASYMERAARVAPRYITISRA